MSTFTQTLNRILKYLEVHKPEAISLLQPGLSQTEIEEIVKDLPIKIPQDICDLYTWKNGSEDSPCQENTAYIFNGFSFYPLEEVIEKYRQKLIKRHCCTLNIYSPDWLEIFFCYIGQEVRGYVAIDRSQETNQIIFAYHKDGEKTYPQYTNLTSMITTIAECYETGAYFVAKDEYFTGSVTNYSQKAHQIWCKYNSEIVDSPLENLQQ